MVVVQRNGDGYEAVRKGSFKSHSTKSSLVRLIQLIFQVINFAVRGIFSFLVAVSFHTGIEDDDDVQLGNETME